MPTRDFFKRVDICKLNIDFNIVFNMINDFVKAKMSIPKGMDMRATKIVPFISLDYD